MKVEYVGPEAGGIDVPAADIIRWKPGEVREVPEAIAKSLLERASEFRQTQERGHRNAMRLGETSNA